LISTSSEPAEIKTDPAPIHNRSSSDPKTNTGNSDHKDSCPSQAPVTPPPGWKLADDSDPFEQPKGAGLSTEAPGAGPEQPSANAEQDLPKNSAQKGSGRKVDFDNPRCRGTSPRQEAGGGYPADFEIFWQTCPKRRGGAGGKAQPYKKWRSWSQAQKDQALRSAQAWAKQREGKDPEFTQKIIRWINEGCWETAEGDWKQEQSDRSTGKFDNQKKSYAQQNYESVYSI
jgi:hypothetical protein